MYFLVTRSKAPSSAVTGLPPQRTFNPRGHALHAYMLNFFTLVNTFVHTRLRQTRQAQAAKMDANAMLANEVIGFFEILGFSAPNRSMRPAGENIKYQKSEYVPKGSNRLHAPGATDRKLLMRSGLFQFCRPRIGSSHPRASTLSWASPRSGRRLYDLSRW